MTFAGLKPWLKAVATGPLYISTSLALKLQQYSGLYQRYEGLLVMHEHLNFAPSASLRML